MWLFILLIIIKNALDNDSEYINPDNWFNH